MRQMTLPVILAVLLTVASAEIPTVMNYQGKVTDTSGNPVADGAYTTRFRIYNVSSGGSALWDSGNRNVTVSGGYGVYYSGGLAGTGPKPCVVKTSQGPTLMYCQESPENWFEDFGEGQVVNGRCHIERDPLFLETVTTDGAHPMHVFIEPHGPCKWTYVERGMTGFDVIEQEGGSSTVSFAYRVVAKRKGFERDAWTIARRRSGTPTCIHSRATRSFGSPRRSGRVTRRAQRG